MKPPYSLDARIAMAATEMVRLEREVADLDGKRRASYCATFHGKPPHKPPQEYEDNYVTCLTKNSAPWQTCPACKKAREDYTAWQSAIRRLAWSRRRLRDLVAIAEEKGEKENAALSNHDA